LHKSHLLARLATGDAPTCNYNINCHDYTMSYYLTDGIYLNWETFVRTIGLPTGEPS
jgi:hypothetical protein